jgi:hypothetical protein
MKSQTQYELDLATARSEYLAAEERLERKQHASRIRKLSVEQGEVGRRVAALSAAVAAEASGAVKNV